ncbi:replication initiation protein, partial [Psychrobacter immobilis]|uniref:replication initiation protein n=2 Tax=Psychrobacter TaxID=497 RepID=UPI003FD2F8A0
MYNIQKVDLQNWQDSPILSQYFNDLPDKPYCSYIKNFCEIRAKKCAIERVYIQPNPPVRVNYIVIDIDHPNGIHAALYDADLPPPHLIIQNPENAHVHLVYKLKHPVYMWGKAKAKHIRYLARVEYGMVRKLGADASYGGNLMKNPLSDVWNTYTTTAPLEGYTLKYLA